MFRPALVALLLLLTLLPLPGSRAEGVPPERLAALSRGVNLSHWIWLPQAADAQARARFITPDELAALRRAGLTHVRLPFEPASIWDAERHEFRLDGLAELRGAIQLCVDSGLAVIVDAHPTDSRSPWATLDEHGACNELEPFWTCLARNLAQTDPSRVFIEILNEPHGLRDKNHWPAAQRRLAELIRTQAPRHTIIATGDEWGSIEGLLRLAPLPDRNVVYSFHFYEPHNFTHQGATWGYAPWRHMKGIPYPSTSAQLEPIAAGIADKDAAAAVRWYSKDPWDAARLTAMIGRAAEWSKSNGVPVYCGEFGVYAAFSPRDARLAWLRDTSAALAASNFGWAMWDYTGGFALAPGKPGERSLDTGVARSLGLDVAGDPPAGGRNPSP